MTVPSDLLESQQVVASNFLGFQKAEPSNVTQFWEGLDFLEIYPSNLMEVHEVAPSNVLEFPEVAPSSLVHFPGVTPSYGFQFLEVALSKVAEFPEAAHCYNLFQV